MLGIQRPRELRREPEEFGVEFVDAVDDRRRLTYAGLASTSSPTPAARTRPRKGW